MAFDPVELCELAETLVGSDSIGEAWLRTAVSRAYYAAFLQARTQLRRQGTQFTGTGSEHRRAVAGLRMLDPTLGQQLEKLRVARNEADYDLESVWSVERVRQLVQGARRILEGLAAL